MPSLIRVDVPVVHSVRLTSVTHKYSGDDNLKLRVMVNAELQENDYYKEEATATLYTEGGGNGGELKISETIRSASGFLKEGKEITLEVKQIMYGENNVQLNTNPETEVEQLYLGQQVEDYHREENDFPKFVAMEEEDQDDRISIIQGNFICFCGNWSALRQCKLTKVTVPVYNAND